MVEQGDGHHDERADSEPEDLDLWDRAAPPAELAGGDPDHGDSEGGEDEIPDLEGVPGAQPRSEPVEEEADEEKQPAERGDEATGLDSAHTASDYARTRSSRIPAPTRP
jgi:hypothetical protein